MNRLHASIGQIANDSLEQKLIIDLLDVYTEKADDGIHHYFLNQAEAFYKRQKPQKNRFFAKLFS